MAFWKKNKHYLSKCSILLAVLMLLVSLFFWLSGNYIESPYDYIFNQQQQNKNILAPIYFQYGFKWKSYLLHREAPNITIAVFGASSTHPINGSLFSDKNLFNFSHSYASFGCSAIYYSYLIDHAPKLKTIIFAMDVFPYYFYKGDTCVDKEEVEKILSTGKVSLNYFDFRFDPRDISARVDRFANRLKRLMKTKDWAGWWEPHRTQCMPDGIGIDFTNDICRGYYHDGARNIPVRVSQKIGPALGWVEQKYWLAFRNKRDPVVQKNINVDTPKFLEELKVLFSKAKEKGITTYILLPPLMPGIENELLSFFGTSDVHQEYKNLVTDFAAKNQIPLIDAIASEKYGCKDEMFHNQNHPGYDCYKNIFAKEFKPVQKDEN